MTQSARTTIVGAGIYGMSFAWALQQAGHQVTLIDKGPIPNPVNTSYDQHRLIRYSYGPELGYTRLVAPAFAAWDRLWADLGRSHYRRTGALGISTETGGWVGHSIELGAREGIETESLTPEQLADRFDYVDTSGIVTAMYQPDAGLLFADRIAGDMTRLLRARGVTMLEKTEVVELDPERASVTLSDGRRIKGDHLVIAAGAWLNKLTDRYAATFDSTRRTVAFFEVPPDLAESWGGAPMVMDLQHVGSYFVVPPAEGTWLKIGTGGPVTDDNPDDSRALTDAETQALVDAARKRLRGADRFRLVGGSACYQMYTPRNELVAEPMGANGWVFSCCSGHGYKFAPYFALELASLLEGAGDPAAFTRMVAGDSNWKEPGQ